MILRGKDIVLKAKIQQKLDFCNPLKNIFRYITVFSKIYSTMVGVCLSGTFLTPYKIYFIEVCHIWGWGCIFDATVMNICLFIMVASKRQIPWGFVIYGAKQNTFGFCHKDLLFYWECPHIYKSNPLVTNPNLPQRVFILTNERPGNLSHDAFLTKSQGLFQDCKNLMGYPSQKYLIKVCHILGFVSLTLP